METLEVLERREFDYDGPVALACGGPTQQQKQAATSTTNIDTQLANDIGTNLPLTNSFYGNMMLGGLPYFNQESQYSTSDIAKQLNDAKAAMAAKNAGYGGALPSGFAAAEDTGLDEDAMQAFDQNQMNLLQQNTQAKVAGAQGLNPLAAGQTAITGANSVMQAPLQNNFWTNLIGGLLGAGTSLGSAVLGA